MEYFLVGKQIPPGIAGGASFQLGVSISSIEKDGLFYGAHTSLGKTKACRFVQTRQYLSSERSCCL